MLRLDGLAENQYKWLIPKSHSNAPRFRSKGFSLLEVIFGASIFVVMTVGAVGACKFIREQSLKSYYSNIANNTVRGYVEAIKKTGYQDIKTARDHPRGLYLEFVSNDTTLTPGAHTKINHKWISLRSPTGINLLASYDDHDRINPKDQLFRIFLMPIIETLPDKDGGNHLDYWKGYEITLRYNWEYLRLDIRGEGRFPIFKSESVKYR